MKTKTYLRVGTSYYKYVSVPLVSGEAVLQLVSWSRETIIHDHGKTFLNSIPKYDGFCLIPEHINYREVIDNHLNKYEPLPFQPLKGECSAIVQFLTDIFAEQLDVILDYLTILYKYPSERLPVICLVSTERNTGKSTFINLLKSIFGSNCTFNTNEDFRSNFNSHWSGKLICAIEETLLERKEDSERIKNLSTAKIYKTEAKGQDRYETEMFCKFVLCSNNINNFIYIEPGETRYWVRELKPLPAVNHHLLEDMQKEIPAFLFFLMKREITIPKTTRMWFPLSAYQTKALKRLINYNRNKLEMILVETIRQIMDAKDLEQFTFCYKDLSASLNNIGKFKIDDVDIKRLIREQWKLTPVSNATTYRTFILTKDGFIIEREDKGRCFNIFRNWMDENFVDLLL